MGAADQCTMSHGTYITTILKSASWFGGGLVHISNNHSDVARSVYIRSVLCNDNSLRHDVSGCSTLLPVWHLAESCACAKVFGLWKGLIYYASNDHWDVETLRSALFTKRAQTQILTLEFHMYSGLNMSGLDTTLWYMYILWHKSHKKMIWVNISSEIISATSYQVSSHWV